MANNDGAWLAGLTPGQRGAILSPGFDTRAKLVTVERLTATQIVLVGDDRRFRRDDGRQVGDHRVRLLPPDDQQVRSAQVRQTYESAYSGVYQIERRVDSTNPRTPETYAQGLRDLVAVTSAALAAVDALLGLGAAGEAPEHLSDTGGIE